MTNEEIQLTEQEYNTLFKNEPNETWKFQDLKDEASRIQEYEYDNKIGPYCDGLTYLEIEQIYASVNNIKLR
jgi:hypothetical protein